MLALWGCAPDYADSAPRYPGWALEQEREASPLAPGVFELVAEGRALNPCTGCTLENEGHLTVQVRVEHIGTAWGAEPGVDLRLSLGGETAERHVTRTGEVLLRVPLFEDCAQDCQAVARFEVAPATDLRGSWTAEASWLTTHDSKTWKPEATLVLR